MILNLLRVEQLRVEDMMKRSFSEINNQKRQGDHRYSGFRIMSVKFAANMFRVFLKLPTSCKEKHFELYKYFTNSYYHEFYGFTGKG